MTDVKKRSIKFWSKDDQPREKMLNKGPAALSDTELIAILIRTGTQEATAIELARQILDSVDNDLIRLSELSCRDLMKHKGIALAKAISIAAALELGKRRRSAEVKQRSKIGDSREAYEYFLGQIEDFTQEHFLVLFLNRNNEPLAVECISTGGVTSTIADPKVIFSRALTYHATAVVLCHNHPSGNPTPSREDVQLTKKLKAGGLLLDIGVTDHIIIGRETYYSFAENGKMDA